MALMHFSAGAYQIRVFITKMACHASSPPSDTFPNALVLFIINYVGLLVEHTVPKIVATKKAIQQLIYNRIALVACKPTTVLLLPTFTITRRPIGQLSVDDRHMTF
jgi:hypothetical protein